MEAPERKNNMKLIDKDAVVAEIQKRIKKYATINVGGSKELDALYGAKCKALMEILSFLDTLEMKDVNEIIKTAEDHAYFAGSENTREKLIDKACEWLRKGGSDWYLTSEYGEDEIDFVKLAEDFRKAMEG